MANALCQGKDSNGKVAPMGATTDSSGNPAGNVVIGANEFFVSGTRKSHVMEVANADLSGASGVDKIWVGTCKAYRLIMPQNTNGQHDNTVFADSTTAADQAAIAVRVNALRAALAAAAGDGAAHIGGVFPMRQRGAPYSDWVTWDGTNEILTIGLAGSTANGGTPAFPYNVVLETIE